MKLEQIGFYTLSDERCQNSSENSSLQRCELILTGRCNFKCPYCRRVGGPDMPFLEASRTVQLWASQGLRAIRFSGGEPTLYPGLYDLVSTARDLGIKYVALSTNGSAKRGVYDRLLACGVNDFSISLDACCVEDNLLMTGGVKSSWDTVVANIRYLSMKTYVTVGIVLADQNVDKVNSIVSFAASLGVHDIRIIPAAQNGDRLKDVEVDDTLIAKFPILAYRVRNIQQGKPVRGLRPCDTTRCGLVLDDMAVNGGQHYPCIIFLREGGEAIGKVGENMREERKAWYDKTNTHENPICKSQCLDVCSFYNNQYDKFHRLQQYVFSIPRIDETEFDWFRWRQGSPRDLFGISCHSGELIKSRARLREFAVGWCPGECLICRPKLNTVAVMFFKDGRHSWFHLFTHEFYKIFEVSN